jgi:hypothetical protein
MSACAGLVGRRAEHFTRQPLPLLILHATVIAHPACLARLIGLVGIPNVTHTREF